MWWRCADTRRCIPLPMFLCLDFILEYGQEFRNQTVLLFFPRKCREMARNAKTLYRGKVTIKCFIVLNRGNRPLKFLFSHSDEGFGTMHFSQARTKVHLTVTACMEALTFLKTPAHAHCPVAALLRRLPPTPNTSILTCKKMKIATTKPTTGQDIANSKKVSITILAIYYTCIP